jgi:hypothetical protein
VIAAAGVLAALPAAAGQVDWAHQNGSLQSNGSVAVRSLSGVNSSVAQNPNGAVAKTNQSAATQPATVLVQATSGTAFNYQSDCFIMTIGGNGPWIGAGKIDAANKFTGVIALTGKNASTGASNVILSMMTGGSNYSVSGSSGYQTATSYQWCGSNTACSGISEGYYNSGGGTWTSYIIGVSTIQTTSFNKCYP